MRKNKQLYITQEAQRIHGLQLTTDNVKDFYLLHNYYSSQSNREMKFQLKYYKTSIK